MREFKDEGEKKDEAKASSSSSSSASSSSSSSSPTESKEREVKEQPTHHCCGKRVNLLPRPFLRDTRLYTTGKKPVQPTADQQSQYKAKYLEFVKARAHTVTCDGETLAERKEQLVFCPRADCEGSYGFTAKKTLNATCVHCDTIFCTSCNVTGRHRLDGITCSAALQQRAQAFAGLDVHICRECGTAIQKNGGCDKVICGTCRWTCCWACKSDTLIQLADLEGIIREYRREGIELQLGHLDSYRYTHAANGCRSVTEGGEYGFIWRTLDEALDLLRDVMEQTGTPGRVITDVIARLRRLGESRQHQ